MSSSLDRWITGNYGEDGWTDPIEEATCTICDKPLSNADLERLNDNWEPTETMEDALASALCGECRKMEEGEDEE